MGFQETFVRKISSEQLLTVDEHDVSFKMGGKSSKSCRRTPLSLEWKLQETFVPEKSAQQFSVDEEIDREDAFDKLDQTDLSQGVKQLVAASYMYVHERRRQIDAMFGRPRRNGKWKTGFLNASIDASPKPVKRNSA